jgi:hypothetical protein
MLWINSTSAHQRSVYFIFIEMGDSWCEIIHTPIFQSRSGSRWPNEEMNKRTNEHNSRCQILNLRINATIESDGVWTWTRLCFSHNYSILPRSLWIHHTTWTIVDVEIRNEQFVFWLLTFPGRQISSSEISISFPRKQYGPLLPLILR